MDTDLTYSIAMSMTPGVDAAVVRLLEEKGVSKRDFLTAGMSTLSEIFGGGTHFEDIKREEALFRARREQEFIGRHSIRALYIEDADYPALLRETPDAPVMLYVLGEADLNSQPAMSIVGTRKCTNYGLGFCKKLIEDLSVYYPDGIIISGLAYGIDACAHTSSIESGMKTVAVVAHGLDTLYPAAHRELARRILSEGGSIVSEYPSGTRPFRKNFLERNRIIAGMSELTVIAESEVKGGAMSTANQAFSYSREVVALPGRVSDISSSGCNMLISKSKASIFTSVADLITLMQWKIPAIDSIPQQRSLFPELEGEQAVIYEELRRNRGGMSADELHARCHIAMPSVMSALTELEFEGIITRLPGARYELM